MNEEIYSQIEVFCDSLIDNIELKDGDVIDRMELNGLSNNKYFQANFSMCHFKGDFMINVSSVIDISEDVCANKLLDNQCYN